MKRYILLAALGASLGCDSLTEPSTSFEPQMVELACMDRVSIGGTVRAVVRTQEEYEALIHQRFTKPLQDYWDAHYDSVLARQMERYPGLTPEEYEDLVRAVFYSVLPFRGTEGCEHPEIDFATHTLIGMDASSDGCEEPEINIKYTPPTAERDAVLVIFVHQFGACEIGRLENVWALVPSIPEAAGVRFERYDSRD